MARHDLLSILGLESLKGILQTGGLPKWGRLEEGVDPRPLLFTQALSNAVLNVFLQQESFLNSDPILLGSWARGQLTPASDLDLLFLGPESEVKNFVAWAQLQGLKIRSRLSEDPEDLAKGVELWDRLSLLDGRALTATGERALAREQDKMRTSGVAEKKRWLKVLREERQMRHERFNSIQNLLEPNLKHGLGGLRDLRQANLLRMLFPDVTISEVHADSLFHFYESFFIWIRVLLHAEGQGDVIAGPLQPQLAQQLGFNDYHAFMSFVQRGLSRVSFYSDWILEQAAASRAAQIRRDKIRLKKPADLTRLLLEDPSVLTQYQVRRSLEQVWPKKDLARRSAERGRELKKFFAPRVRDPHWIALFRSRLMDRLLPELKLLVGYVQHDQYHRYTTDAHILQVIREVLRARQSARHLGPLAAIAKNFTKADWNLLLWAAVYHDLGKGRTGDHSDIGAVWAERDLKAFGVSRDSVTEVTWLVKNHLAFSQAALRRDPQDNEVLSELAKLELTKDRVHRLLIFTALDILGTNPSSWNDWKSQLLVHLGQRLTAPERTEQAKLLSQIADLEPEDQNRLLDIAQEVGSARLLKDLKTAKHKSCQPIEIFTAKKRLWVRYHQHEDRKGALAQILGVLFQSGASVLHATVMTLPEVGIYDWFCLDASGRSEALGKRLRLLLEQEVVEAPKVKWEKVEVVQEQKTGWTLLFRGLDQRGLLWNAAQALSEVGAEIKSAQVQTWGQKAEDLFKIKAPDQPSSEWIREFRSKLGITDQK